MDTIASWRCWSSSMFIAMVSPMPAARKCASLDDDTHVERDYAASTTLILSSIFSSLVMLT